MASKVRAKSAKRKARRQCSASSLHRLLLSAAAALPCIGLPMRVHSQSTEVTHEARLEYFFYQDWQAGYDKRMRINSPMAWARSSIGEHDQIEGSFVYDAMSGASPQYHDTLSGASGKGIEDAREAGDIALTHTMEEMSVSVGTSFSHEDDYDSIGGTLETRFWSEDRNTIVGLGFSGSSDQVGSTNDSTLDESKRALGGGIGITQILTPRAMMQSNLTYASSDGYLSDPYKTLDLRPRSRDQWAWLTRYVLYVPQFDSSLHADYRLFRDSWGVIAHTYALSYHQPLGEAWMITPRLRYYSQSKADFYENTFPPENPGDEFYTADQRMSGFGSVTAGVKISRSFMSDLSVQLSVDYLREEGGWKLWSEGSPGLDPISALILGIGMHYRF